MTYIHDAYQLNFIFAGMIISQVFTVSYMQVHKIKCLKKGLVSILWSHA